MVDVEVYSKSLQEATIVVLPLLILDEWPILHGQLLPLVLHLPIDGDDLGLLLLLLLLLLIDLPSLLTTEHAQHLVLIERIVDVGHGVPELPDREVELSCRRTHLQGVERRLLDRHLVDELHEAASHHLVVLEHLECEPALSNGFVFNLGCILFIFFI